MAATVTLIGLKNCDSCRKARAWLDDRHIAHAYTDIRADGLAAADLTGWIAAHGDWQPFVNRRGTTWRNLDEAAKDALDETTAVALITANPTLMKRPVIVVESGGRPTVTVGFGPAEQDRLAAAL